MNHKPVYLTTPIYYVNDVPHIGHAYTSVATDVLARMYRLGGGRVMLATGVDEHGQKIEQAAAAAGMSPQAFCDKISLSFRSLSQTMNVQEDVFIRTTESRHRIAAQAMWNRLLERDQIYLGAYAGWYAVRDETFYAEDEIVDGKAPSGSPVEWVEQPSYMFRLSQWQQPLLDFYAAHPDFIGPDSRRNEVLRFVEGGLTDLSVSRSTFKWGVPVPNDPDHVMYVWVEALTNYLTCVGFPDLESEAYQTLWPQVTHIVGKDILRHHAVIWPALLMAAELPLPQRIFAHGWWTSEGKKISKSLGNAIDPVGLVEQYGVDPVRYFLMREVTFGKDGDFSNSAFKHRINGDLANDLGNLSQRVLSFVQKQVDAKTPVCGPLTVVDLALLEKSQDLPQQLFDCADKQEISKICELIWNVVSEANRYVDSQQPWSLKKTDTDRMQTVLYVLMETIRRIAICAQPLMPGSCHRILDALGVPMENRDFQHWDYKLVSGTALPVPEPIFPRIE
ncbi:MAG: methionine--tRNA ligase [Alphaproteobacteria bacterium]|nr:methionine--tRNA ligase [Alphaproteobacteria bacterium]